MCASSWQVLLPALVHLFLRNGISMTIPVRLNASANSSKIMGFGVFKAWMCLERLMRSQHSPLSILFVVFHAPDVQPEVAEAEAVELLPDCRSFGITWS